MSRKARKQRVVYLWVTTETDGEALVRCTVAIRQAGICCKLVGSERVIQSQFGPKIRMDIVLVKPPLEDDDHVVLDPNDDHTIKDAKDFWAEVK